MIAFSDSPVLRFSDSAGMGRARATGRVGEQRQVVLFHRVTICRPKSRKSLTETFKKGIFVGS